LRFVGVNSIDIVAIKGVIMSELNGYWRRVSKRRLLSDTPST
jgi:hypothetical protein